MQRSPARRIYPYIEKTFGKLWGCRQSYFFSSLLFFSSLVFSFFWFYGKSQNVYTNQKARIFCRLLKSGFLTPWCRVSHQAYICPKVRVADFIETKRELNDPCRNLYHRIKHLLFFPYSVPFSFFICTKFDINIETFTNMH